MENFRQLNSAVEDFIQEELCDSDYESFRSCFLFNDVQNLLSLVQGTSEFKTPSFYKKEILKEALADPQILFPFLGDSLQDLLSEKNREDCTKSILYRMMENLQEGLIPSAIGFPQEYLEFEMRLKNLTMALSFRSAGLPHSDHLVPFDHFSRMLRESKAPDFSLTRELELCAPLLEVIGSSKVSEIEVEKAICDVRWKWLEQRTEQEIFSKEAVHAFGIKFADVKRWIDLKPEEGRAKLDEILTQLHDDLLGTNQEECV